MNRSKDIVDAKFDSANNEIANLAFNIVELKKKIEHIEDSFEDSDVSDVSDSWIKGYANIMNYNLNTAYGRKSDEHAD